MTYDRNESRRGWREPRSRFSDDNRDRPDDRFGRGSDRDEREDRGFFDRAGDEVASWFGDEEAERRRRDDARFGRTEDEGLRRPRAFMSDDEFSRYDRSPRFRDEGYRRPYTGRFTGRRYSGDDDRSDRGGPERSESNPARRDFTEMAASGLHDPHYSEWRRQQIDALDRDYDEYRRENQGRFESDFSNWRTGREGKRQLLGQVREHMTVVGSDEEHLGTVDCVRGDRVVLTKDDSAEGQHHVLSCSLVDRVEGDRVILDRPAAEAKRVFSNENRDRALFERDEDRETGPHILNRSFSGTY